MITYVRLRNWRSHEDSVLEFSEGVNALIGINGSGKSSVLDAISFALFGTFPALKARRMSTEDLIMKKPGKKDSCTVEVGFSSGGSEYKVTRSISRAGPSKAELMKGGSPLQAGPELVTGEIVRALQMDYDLFSKAVYSEQNGMDYFLRVQKGRRMGEIDRMLKVDRFEEVRTGAVSITNRIKSACEEKLRIVADIQREGLNAKLDATGAEIGRLQAERSAISGELSSAKSAVAGLESALAGMEKSEDECNRLKSGIEAAKSSLASATESLERVKKRLEGRDAASVSAEKAKLASEISAAEAGSSLLEKSLQEKRLSLAEAGAKAKVEEASAGSLEKLGARCPTCEGEVSAEKKALLCGRHREEAAALRAKSNAIAAELARLSSEADAARASLDSKRKAMAMMSMFASDIGESEILEKKILDSMARKVELEERLATASSGYDREKLSSLRMQLRKAAEAEAVLNSKDNMLSGRIGDKMQIAAGFAERLKVMEKYKSEADSSSKAAHGMEEFVKALRLTQEQLRSEFLKAVNSILGEVWTMLYPYGDFKGLRLSSEDDYSLELEEPGGWAPVESVSGGERSIAALALRIAFSRAFLPNLSWLILDEPTHNLDAKAIAQFSEILREKMGMFAEQVFIITHEDRISEGVTGRMYRFERDKESDGATKVIVI